jgi:hypothetical protein
MAKQITEAQAASLFRDTEELKTAYQIVFGAGPAGQAVLDDLGRFCRANEPCWSEDQRHHARLEGRREVWLRIQAEINMPSEELLQRRIGDNYVVMKIEPEDETDNG